MKELQKFESSTGMLVERTDMGEFVKGVQYEVRLDDTGTVHAFDGANLKSMFRR